MPKARIAPSNTGLSFLAKQDWEKKVSNIVQRNLYEVLKLIGNADETLPKFTTITDSEIESLRFQYLDNAIAGKSKIVLANFEEKELLIAFLHHLGYETRQGSGKHDTHILYASRLTTNA